MDRQRRWDEYGISLAREGATMSKDPSTQVGACLMRPDGTIAAVSWNGFPRGVADDDRLYDRPTKYKITLHAEVNALLACKENMQGFTLYVTPLHPCCNCAAQIIQAGIKRVVYEQPEDVERWAEDFALSKKILTEGGVTTMNFEPTLWESSTPMKTAE